MKYWLGSGSVALALAFAPVLAPAAALGAEASAGRAAYEKYCANCHGADARKLARTTLTLTAVDVDVPDYESLQYLVHTEFPDRCLQFARQVLRRE